MLKHVVLKSTLIAFICSASLAAHARADEHKPINVPAGDLIAALKTLAQQSGVDLVYRSDQLEGLHTQGIAGTFSAEEAATKLLEGTALIVKMDSSGAMLIALPRASSAPQAPAPANTQSKSDSKPKPTAEADEGRRSFWDRFRLAQVDQGQTSGGRDVAKAETASESTDRVKLEEIVVTAQKRQERLQDVPVPVTALSATALANSNQVRLQDYYARIPGINLNTDGRSGIPTISIRGITTGGFSNASVGIVVDDVPYGSSLTYGGGSLAPDFDPSDLAQVEVLRGPQGTLYGASSMGGLIKYSTIAPSTDRVSGRVQAGVSGVRNGDGAGFSLRGAVNLPFSESLAVRASGFSRRTPGYIDDPVADLRGVNREDADGGRVALLWQPSEVFSLKLNALLQNIDRLGSANVQPSVGDLEHSELRGTGESKRDSRVFSAVAAADLGGGSTLTFVTGYNTNKLTGSSDFSSFASFFGPGVQGVGFVDDNRTSRFTQEIRVAVPIGEKFDWLLGGFFQNENSSWGQSLVDVNPATGQAGTVFIDFFNTVRLSEYAAFTDLTYKISDRFDVQIGARESHENESYFVIETGPAVPIFTGGLPSPFIKPETTSTANTLTYLLTPRFRVSPDLMVYARFASGYRPGGPNPNSVGSFSEYKPDTTRNYEIGAKGNLFGHALAFDASVYYIDWRDIQLSVTVNGNSINDNGSRAKSQGVELSLESRPLRGMRISAWGAWNDTALTEPLPAEAGLFGLSGDRLPYSSRYSGSLSLDQDFPITGNLTASVGGSVSYVGRRLSIFTPTADRQIMPAYTQVDLRAGIQHESWALDLFATNVTDRRAILSGGIGTLTSNAFNYIQPRTIGLSWTKTFSSQ